MIEISVSFFFFVFLTILKNNPIAMKKPHPIAIALAESKGVSPKINAMMKAKTPDNIIPIATNM